MPAGICRSRPCSKPSPQLAAWIGKTAGMPHAKPTDTTFGRGPGQWPGPKYLLAHSCAVFAFQADSNTGANHQARNVMGAVTGFPGIRQRRECISAATRLASDRAVIPAYIVPSVVARSALVVVPDVRERVAPAQESASAHLPRTFQARAGGYSISQGRSAFCHGCIAGACYALRVTTIPHLKRGNP